nr:hypothetical protein SHINE37_42186 [Rhizobiaceae bacterium]
MERNKTKETVICVTLRDLLHSH